MDDQAKPQYSEGQLPGKGACLLSPCPEARAAPCLCWSIEGDRAKEVEAGGT